MKPGTTVIVNAGRYMLKHGVVARAHADRGAHGFAEVNFIGASGYPLKRNGTSTVPPTDTPPVDMLPLSYLNAFEATKP